MATKSYKIILLLTVFVMSIAFAFGLMNTKSVYAEDNPLTVTNEISNYFKMDKHSRHKGVLWVPLARAALYCGLGEFPTCAQV